MTKNFGNAVTKEYTKNMFLKYGNAGKKVNENFNSLWRLMKKTAREKNWEWYNKLGPKWRHGSFNNVLNTLQHTVINKLSNLKIGSVKVKQISEFIGTITEPIKTTFEKIGTAIKNSKWYSKLKFLGKFAKISGWISMGVDASITTITEYNNQNSRAYKSEGKSLIHAAVSQLKSAGPIEGAIAGSWRGGPGLAMIGFLAGLANTVLGIVRPEAKDAMYSALQNTLDDIYDFVENSQVGKAVSGAVDSIKQIFNGGLVYGK